MSGKTRLVKFYYHLYQWHSNCSVLIDPDFLNCYYRICLSSKNCSVLTGSDLLNYYYHSQSGESTCPTLTSSDLLNYYKIYPGMYNLQDYRNSSPLCHRIVPRQEREQGREEQRGELLSKGRIRLPVSRCNRQRGWGQGLHWHCRRRRTGSTGKGISASIGRYYKTLQNGPRNLTPQLG